MSLHGSLDDFSLPDVLALLAATGKTGRLAVHRLDDEAGAVWFAGGQVIGAEASASVDLDEGLFELLRVTSGMFRFEADRLPAVPGEPTRLEPLLERARERLVEWRGIEAVVPSLATPAALVRKIAAPVEVSPQRWDALVAVAEGGSVAAVAERLGTGEFGACRAVKDLVDAGLVTVAGSSVPPPPSAASETEDPRTAVRYEEIEPAVPQPSVLTQEDGTEISRSVLLKFLASVRS